MSSTEMREFWIEFQTEGEGLRIEVGRGEEAEGFMSRAWDHNPATSWPPTHIAFAAFGRNVDYKFCLLGTEIQGVPKKMGIRVKGRFEGFGSFK